MRRIVWIVVAMMLAAGAPGVARAQAGGGGGTGGVQADLDEAQKAFDDKEFDRAIEKYGAIIAKDKQGSAVAYWKLATILLVVKKDPKGALRACEQGERAIPDSGDIKRMKGLALHKLGRGAEAIKALEEAFTAATPPTITFDANAALCELQFKVSCEKSVKACTGFLDGRPTEMAKLDPTIRLIRGAAANLCGKHQEALGDFEAVLKTYPKAVAAQVGKFESMFRMGDCGRAAVLGEELNRAGAGQKHPVVHFGLAKCYVEFRRPHEAVTQARMYVDRNGQDLAGRVLLGDAHRAKGDPASAIAAYREVISRDPSHTEALTKMGDALLSSNRFTEARDIAEKVLARAPGNPDASILLARAALKLKQPKKAIDALEALKGASRTGAVLFTLGWAYHDAGDLAVSAVRFDEAVRAGRRDAVDAGVRVRNRLAGQYLKDGKLAEAEATLGLALKSDAGNITTAQNLGLVRILKGDPAGAITALDLCLKRKPTDIVVNRLLGRAYLIKRDRDAAMRYYAVAEKSAERVRGQTLGELYAETGPLYLDQGQLDPAVTRLETAEAENRDAKITPIIKRNLAIAYLKRGMDFVRKKTSDRAVTDLTRAVERKEFMKKDERAQLHCALAFALLSGGRASDASKEFSAAAQAGGCQLKAPYDRLGIDFFQAYAKYRDGGPGNVRDALKLFGKLAGKATGPLGQTMKDLQRSGHEQLAVSLFNRDDYRGAAAELKAAKGLGARGSSLEHNLAVIDLVEGRGAQAARTFESLGGRPAEALMNLGIHYDRQGEPQKALEMYRKAADRGVRAARLKGWIDVKERLFGGR
ncbi:MAG TPA: tetratricopeptide repeat protein [Polyangia bacterium]|jgi:tetratricopeptide (TPR) repeat protein